MSPYLVVLKMQMCRDTGDSGCVLTGVYVKQTMEVGGEACYTLENSLCGTQVATVELSFNAVNS